MEDSGINDITEQRRGRTAVRPYGVTLTLTLSQRERERSFRYCDKRLLREEAAGSRAL